MAIEVCYHYVCYRRYTRFLSNPTIGQEIDSIYSKAYDLFCKEIIDERLCKNHEIFFMTKLVGIFRSYIRKCAESDEEYSSYKSSSLKKRLQKSHPQLVFHAPGRRNRSELVYAENLSAGSVAEHFNFSGEESSDDEGYYSPNTSMCHSEEEDHACLYRAAIILKNIIKSVPMFYTTWPPTAVLFNKEAVIRTVPSELFNFLCLLLGLSDEPIEPFKSMRDSVADGYGCKIDSIAQDLIYLSSKGQKQTPKSLSLGVLVRQLTACEELISILNSFGHCASYETVVRHETALATMQSIKTSLVTRDMVKHQPTILIFDNQDYNEETKSGKGQTHIAAGIAVQRQQSQLSRNEHTEKISKRRRSLTLNEEELPVYNLGKKQSLDVHHLQEHISTDITAHSCPNNWLGSWTWLL